MCVFRYAQRICHCYNQGQRCQRHLGQVVHEGIKRHINKPKFMLECIACKDWKKKHGDRAIGSYDCPNTVPEEQAVVDYILELLCKPCKQTCVPKAGEAVWV